MISSPPHSDPQQDTVQIDIPQQGRRIPCPPDTLLSAALASAGITPRMDCGGKGSCGQCRVRIEPPAAAPPTDAELRWLNPAQLAAGVRLACQCRPLQDLTIRQVRRAPDFDWRPIPDDDLRPLTGCAHKPRPGLGLAIDLGSTHIRLTIWDMEQGKRIAARSCLNPQIDLGADVLTRLMVATESPAQAGILRSLVIDTIGRALAEVRATYNLGETPVREAMVVGNTTMLTLLAGQHYQQLLDPDNWTRQIACQPDRPEAFVSAWHLACADALQLIPPLGGFVGSDLVAGVLALGLTQGDAPALLIDFGTNSEMALWDGSRLWVTSTAGGPAFEGSGISCGMPAELGAVYRVMSSPAGLDLRVIGNVAPEGLCGSGLVDAIALLRKQGGLDHVGRLRGGLEDRLLLDDGMLSLQAGDIDTFQRAKAAIGSGVRWLCKQAGSPQDRLRRVCISGAFGKLLDTSAACEVGLLPDVAPALVELDGNTALAGCEMLLLGGQAQRATADLMSCTRQFNMAEDEDYERLFVESLYLEKMRA